MSQCKPILWSEVLTENMLHEETELHKSVPFKSEKRIDENWGKGIRWEGLEVELLSGDFGFRYSASAHCSVLKRQLRGSRNVCQDHMSSWADTTLQQYGDGSKKMMLGLGQAEQEVIKGLNHNDGNGKTRNWRVIDWHWELSRLLTVYFILVKQMSGKDIYLGRSTLCTFLRSTK